MAPKHEKAPKPEKVEEPAAVAPKPEKVEEPAAVAPKPEKVEEPAAVAPKAQSLSVHLNDRLDEIGRLLGEADGKKSPSNILKRLRAFRVDLNQYLDKAGIAG